MFQCCYVNKRLGFNAHTGKREGVPLGKGDHRGSPLPRCRKLENQAASIHPTTPYNPPCEGGCNPQASPMSAKLFNNSDSLPTS